MHGQTQTKQIKFMFNNYISEILPCMWIWINIVEPARP
jgi:hypothetical protein